MSNNQNTGAKGILGIIGTYIVTMMVAILIIVFITMIFIDTTKCSSVSNGLAVLLGMTAVVFIASVFVVKSRAWKITPSTAGRWAILAAYGTVMLVSFVVIAFGLLVIFNC